MRRISPTIHILFVNLLGELVHRLIAALADGFVDLHLQNQVAAAFEVEAELDAVREILLHLRQGRGELRQADQTINANNMTMRMKMNFHLSWEFMRAA